LREKDSAIDKLKRDVIELTDKLESATFQAERLKEDQRFYVSHCSRLKKEVEELRADLLKLSSAVPRPLPLQAQPQPQAQPQSSPLQSYPELEATLRRWERSGEARPREIPFPSSERHPSRPSRASREAYKANIRELTTDNQVLEAKLRLTSQCYSLYIAEQCRRWNDMARKFSLPQQDADHILDTLERLIVQECIFLQTRSGDAFSPDGSFGAFPSSRERGPSPAFKSKIASISLIDPPLQKIRALQERLDCLTSSAARSASQVGVRSWSTGVASSAQPVYPYPPVTTGGSLLLHGSATPTASNPTGFQGTKEAVLTATCVSADLPMSSVSYLSHVRKATESVSERFQKSYPHKASAYYNLFQQFFDDVMISDSHVLCLCAKHMERELQNARNTQGDCEAYCRIYYKLKAIRKHPLILQFSQFDEAVRNSNLFPTDRERAIYAPTAYLELSTAYSLSQRLNNEVVAYLQSRPQDIAELESMALSNR